MGLEGGRRPLPFLPRPTPPSPSGTNKVASNQHRGATQRGVSPPHRDPVHHITASKPNTGGLLGTLANTIHYQSVTLPNKSFYEGFFFLTIETRLCG